MTADEIFGLCESIFSKVVVANKIKLPRWVEIIDSNYNYHFAILTHFQREKNSNEVVEFYQGMICTPETKEAKMLATYDANLDSNPPKLVIDRKTG